MIFLTGVTGFVGSNIAAYLLSEGHDLCVISRDSKELDYQSRVFRAIKLTGYKINEQSINLHILKGDMTLPLLGLSQEELSWIKMRGITELWHSAGSINFVDEEINKAVNVGGMKNLLSFMNEIEIEKVFYLGTAYADANKVAETYFQIDLPRFNNPYEETKTLSEEMLLAWGLENPQTQITVFKPSIVVGDTELGKAFNFSGYYRFMQSFHFFRNNVLKEANGKDINMPINVLGHEKAEVNVIAVDYAIDLMMKIRANEKTGVFPIVNNRAPEYKNILQLGLNYLKIFGVEYLDGNERQKNSDKKMDRIERMLHKAMRDYVPYVSWTYKWDLRPTIDACGGTFVSHPEVNQPFIDKMLGFAVENEFELSV
ncbi:hypothetical protein C0583_05025 [Candidatus Parcubacteria bacterium]|nr:MAG: hypothetical protein C0583_05025 [Candidatus Parcubacteria bacterium]